MLVSLFAFLLILKTVARIALTAPITEIEPKNDEVQQKTLNDQIPKLRILIVTMRIMFSESHYMFHRKLAELLASDVENVEKVLLLVYNADSANQHTEEPHEFDGRLSVWTRTAFRDILWLFSFTSDSPKWSAWEDNSRTFLPTSNVPVSQLTDIENHLILIEQCLAWGKKDLLLAKPVLITQLQQFSFNVGIMETLPWDLSLSTFRAFPSIKKYVVAQSTSPTITQWKYLGYEKIVGAMPGRDLARIGDNKFATESAIRENPEYFRDRNESMYIKPSESSAMSLRQQYLEAIERGILPRQNFEDFILHENIFCDWDLKHRLDLSFTNTQPFLEFPVVEQEIERERSAEHKKRIYFIGGITMPKGKVPNLNADTQKVFDSAKDGGVVLFCFGSVVELHDGDQRAISIKNNVVDAFKQYPQMNIIIKWGKNGSTPGQQQQYDKLAENVYAKSWIEQLAILGAGPKLFISHGGQNSINEAIKFGVPMILFPFFGDQFNCSEAMAARGVAKVLDFRSKTLKNDLTEALTEIFGHYSMYKQRIDVLSRKMNSVEPAKDFVAEFRQLRKTL